MMLTRMQNMYDYTGYIKCGEILRPPCESTTRPYALKCIHCKEIYLLFEAFIFHIEDHCKNAILEMQQNPDNMKPLSIDQDNTTQKPEKYSLYDNEDKNSPSFMQTDGSSVVIKSENISDDNKDISVKKDINTPDDIKTIKSTTPSRPEGGHNSTILLLQERPSAVIKSENTSDDNMYILVKEDPNPPDDIKTIKSTTPARPESQLNKDGQINNNCNSKKLQRLRIILENCRNSRTKTTNVAKDNAKKKIPKKPITRIGKTYKTDELEFKSCVKQHKQKSNMSKTYESIDDNFEREPPCLEEETENNENEHFLTRNNDVNNEIKKK